MRVHGLAFHIRQQMMVLFPAVFGGPGVGKHTTVITTTADEDTMKLCLQMLNYAYTEEGMLYWNYGDEGVSWEYDEDGVPQFTSLVKDDPGY